VICCVVLCCVVLCCVVLCCVVCCRVEVFATGRPVVQRISTDRGVSECDRESSIMWKPWPTRGSCAMIKKKITLHVLSVFNLIL
jgi:hypothetical protein